LENQSLAAFVPCARNVLSVLTSVIGEIVSNVGRILTLRVKITDHEKGESIWENHVKKDTSDLMGFRIDTIANGDVFKERDDLEDLLNKYRSRFGWHEDDI
jgi:hypothetical protein